MNKVINTVDELERVMIRYGLAMLRDYDVAPKLLLEFYLLLPKKTPTS